MPRFGELLLIRDESDVFCCTRTTSAHGRNHLTESGHAPGALCALSLSRAVGQIPIESQTRGCHSLAPGFGHHLGELLC